MSDLHGWLRAVLVLAVFVGSSACRADENLFLEGALPAIFFNDNVDTMQSWQINANDFGFDIHNGTLITDPFHLSQLAPDKSLYISDTGDIGFGTDLPTAGLHLVKHSVEGTAEVMARFVLEDDTIGFLNISNASTTDGVFVPKIVGRSAGQNAALINEAAVTNDTGTSPAIAYNAIKTAGGGLSTRPLVAYRNNNVVKATIAANGTVTALSFNPTSSRTMKHDIVELDSQKAEKALRELTPVEFVYNDDDSAEKRVGFIAEDVPDLVADAGRQSVPIMDVVALLTRVVKDQQQTIDQQRVQLKKQADASDDQKKINDDLLKRLMALESKMQK